MHKKYDINWTKTKGGCQLGRKVVTHDSKSDLPLAEPGKASAAVCTKAYRINDNSEKAQR